MTSGFIMDHAFWTDDRRSLHDAHRPTDVCTSVVVTRHTPRGASFGPCLLQSTFYDTIAFIALKSCDRITKSYVFRIDPEGMRNTTLVLSWLRLVQAARNREEQNTEAYLKAGQLYVRATRDIRQEEELLVWYDQELSHLLGFTDIANKETHEELKCVKCDQVFKHEYPYLAHCRLMCAHIRSDAWSHDTCAQKDANEPMELKRQRRVTDFHNIARDLEHKTTSEEEDAETSPHKRKCEDSVYPKGRKSVLLEKTNIANDHNITPSIRDYEHATGPDSPSVTLKLRPDKLRTPRLDPKGDALQCEGRLTHGRERSPDPERHSGAGGVSGAPLRSAFAALSPSGLQGEQKSAFCKPNKRPYESTLHPLMTQAASSSRLNGISDAFTPSRGVATWGPGGVTATLGQRMATPLTQSENFAIVQSSATPNKTLARSGPPRNNVLATPLTPRTVTGYPPTPPTLMAPNRCLVTGELAGASTAHAHVALNNAFHCAPQHWSRSMASPLQTPSSLAVLPPTFSSFGVSVQNWCAKCNLSFRMTSDLVFHMRSHHKKEFAADSQVRRRREEKLTCPICDEYFRERHHLSRHMTSHN